MFSDGVGGSSDSASSSFLTFPVGLPFVPALAFGAVLTDFCLFVGVADAGVNLRPAFGVDAAEALAGDDFACDLTLVAGIVVRRLGLSMHSLSGAVDDQDKSTLGYDVSRHESVSYREKVTLVSGW